MFLTAILALTLAQAAPAHPPRPPDTDQTVPVQRGGRLTINNFAGDVVIHTWSNDSLHVVARHQSRTKVNIRPTAAGMTVSASGSMGPAGIGRLRHHRAGVDADQGRGSVQLHHD